jgi:hypothetical protein
MVHAKGKNAISLLLGKRLKSHQQKSYMQKVEQTKSLNIEDMKSQQQ